MTSRSSTLTSDGTQRIVAYLPPVAAKNGPPETFASCLPNVSFAPSSPGTSTGRAGCRLAITPNHDLHALTVLQAQQFERLAVDHDHSGRAALGAVEIGDEWALAVLAGEVDWRPVGKIEAVAEEMFLQLIGSFRHSSRLARSCRRSISAVSARPQQGMAISTMPMTMIAVGSQSVLPRAHGCRRSAP